MIVLGLDTSSYSNAIGLIEDGRVIADAAFAACTDTLEKIITHIDNVLKEARLRLEDIDGFGVGLGPGSWTGIRIGVTVGKTLAFSTDKSVCGISTLEVLAFQVSKTDKLICPIISAGIKDNVYAAFYRWQDHSLSREGEFYVGDVAELANLIKEPAVIIGTEISTYLKSIREVSPAISFETIEAVPRGATVALLALQRFTRGESDDVLSLAPLYLKESTARAFISKYTVAQAKG